MFISLKKSSPFLLLIVFLLTSCHFFLPIEPVSEVNRKFKDDYGYSLNKAKKRHKKAIAESGYDGTVPFEKTAYGRLMQERLDFIETNARNNPYVEVQGSGGNPEYLSYNYGAYSTPENDIFLDMDIPNNDFKYYYLGNKDFNEINNIEIQNSYDYMYVINQERLKQIEIARLKQEEMQRQKKKENDMLKKGKSGFKNLTNKIKSLLNKDEK